MHQKGLLTLNCLGLPISLLYFFSKRKGFASIRPFSMCQELPARSFSGLAIPILDKKTAPNKGQLLVIIHCKLRILTLHYRTLGSITKPYSTITMHPFAI